MSTALWPVRWPLIALQECVDKVEQAPDDERQQVKLDLPCATCPEKEACLNAKSKEVGSLMYSREFRTLHRSQEASLFPWETIEPCLDPDLGLVPWWHKPFGVEERYGIATAWDVAYSEKTGADYLVRMTGYVDRHTNLRYLLDIQRWQAIDFDAQMALIEGSWQNWLDDLVVIEDDFHQRLWVRKIEQTSDVPVVGHAAKGKNSLETGVPSLLVKLETRRWRFPYRPGGYHHEALIAFFDELEAFGWVDGKLQGVGEHDDTVMCWYHLEWALERLSVPSGRREKTRDVVPGARL